VLIRCCQKSFGQAKNAGREAKSAGKCSRNISRAQETVDSKSKSLQMPGSLVVIGVNGGFVSSSLFQLVNIAHPWETCMFRFSAFWIAASLMFSVSASAESYHFNRPGISYGAPRVSHGYGGGFAHGGGFSHGGFGYGGGMGSAGGMNYGYGGHFGGQMGYHMQAMPVQQYLVPVTYRVPIFLAPPVRPAAPLCPTGCDTAPELVPHGH